MIPGLSKLTNSGQMPIKFGDAKSGIGDTAFTANAKFGGLNYNTMGSYLVPSIVAIIAFGVLYYVQNKT